LTAPPQGPATREAKALYGFRPFRKRGGVVTNELIDKLREDDALPHRYPPGPLYSPLANGA
jgi:hypothetical protein